MLRPVLSSHVADLLTDTDADTDVDTAKRVKMLELAGAKTGIELSSLWPFRSI